MVIDLGEEDFSVETVLGSLLRRGEGLLATVQDEEGVGFGFVDDRNRFVDVGLLVVHVVVLDEGVGLGVRGFVRGELGEGYGRGKWFEGIGDGRGYGR